MKNVTLIAATLASALLASGSAKAACATVSFTSPTIPTWNPINPAPVVASFTMNIQRASSSSRSARLIILDTNNTSPPVRVGSTGPQYQIVNVGTGSTISFPQGTSIATSTVGLIDLPNGSSGNSVNVSLTVTIPANSGAEDFVGGATFSETLNYSAQCFQQNMNPMGTPDSSVATNLSLSMTIPKLVSITTGSPATINFGSFSTATQTLQVGLKSTSSVNVTVATTNVNKLMLAGAGTPDSTNSIPYTMTLNGDVVANGSSLTNRPRAGVPGSNWPLILTLTGGVPTAKLAGSYSDTITLTLTPGT